MCVCAYVCVCVGHTCVCVGPWDLPALISYVGGVKDILQT